VLNPALNPVRRAAVLGSPIAHSLSPVLHSAAYAALGLERWEYGRHEVREHELAAFVAGLGPEWAGLSLTMPLKRVALDVATEIGETAAAIGAANTLVLRDGTRRAENTDAPGMADALREAGVTKPERVLLLGAGGTAQAAIAALRDLTPAPVRVAVREPSRSGAVHETARRLGVPLEIHPLAEAGALIAGADLVISTLPKGVADDLGRADWAPRSVLFDVVYDPWPTALAAGAAAAGCRIVSGLDLLLHQACHQVTLMTGQPAPVEVMRAALDAARA
jgi:shikimate dehydrogenase